MHCYCLILLKHLVCCQFSFFFVFLFQILQLVKKIICAFYELPWQQRPLTTTAVCENEFTLQLVPKHDSDE